MPTSAYGWLAKLRLFQQADEAPHLHVEGHGGAIGEVPAQVVFGAAEAAPAGW